MLWVVKYKGEIVAGPFNTQSEAVHARQEKHEELHINTTSMTVEHM